MKKQIKVVFVLVLTVAGAACSGGGGSTSDPNAGFKLETLATSPFPGGPTLPTGGRVQGLFLQANGPLTGTVEFFNVIHPGGVLLVPGAKVPAKWRFSLGPEFMGISSLSLTFATVEKI